jgi:hypothetical protein
MSIDTPVHLLVCRAVAGVTYYSSSDLRRGGVLAEMRISLALPLRRALRVLR